MAISANLGLELATVSNFFMNARRRSMDKWCDTYSASSHPENSSSQNGSQNSSRAIASHPANQSSSSSSGTHSPESISSSSGIPPHHIPTSIPSHLGFDSSIPSFLPQHCSSQLSYTAVKAEPFQNTFKILMPPAASIISTFNRTYQKDVTSQFELKKINETTKIRPRTIRFSKSFKIV